MSRFGSYRLRERITVGGTAEVFRAVVPERGGLPVALKKILPQHASDPRFRRLFLEEAVLLSELRHPNIVEILDAGELNGALFLALEQIDGADLGQLLPLAARARLTVPTAVAARVALEVAKALEFIHTARSPSGEALRIVHRDVSPPNILVSRRGEVKLADFGLARLGSEGAHAAGHAQGKPGYLSPEQASAGAPVDARSDLFSLGAVLFEMLSGAPPSETRAEYDRVRPAVRPLALLALRCLERDPARRPASASAVCLELRSWLARVPASAADPGAWARRVLA